MSFFKAVGVLLVVAFSVLGILLMIDYQYRKAFNLEYRLPQNILPKPKPDKQYDLVLLGNSHTESGIDTSHFNDIHTLNLSGVAQRFVFDLALLKHHQAEVAPGAVILINASPISFSHANIFDNDGFGRGYFGRVSPFLIPKIDWADYAETELAPFTRSPFLWREAYDKQLVDSRSEDEKDEFERLSVKQPEPGIKEASSAATVATGGQASPQVSIYDTSNIAKRLESPGYNPELLQESVNFMFQKWYETDEFDPIYFDLNKGYLEDIISYSLEKNWRPVVVTIPVSAQLKSGLLDNYFDVYLYNNIESTDLMGVPYLDYTRREDIIRNTSWFSNSDHLSKEGAAAFSYVLLQDLIDLGYFSENVDGYISSQDGE